MPRVPIKLLNIIRCEKISLDFLSSIWLLKFQVRLARALAKILW